MATPRGPTEVRFNHVPGPGLRAILEGWSDELPEPNNPWVMVNSASMGHGDQLLPMCFQ